MVKDESCHDLDFDTMEESPNPIAKKLYETLQATDQALQLGCEKHSQLCAVARLLCALQRCYDSLLEFLKETLYRRIFTIRRRWLKDWVFMWRKLIVVGMSA